MKIIDKKRFYTFLFIGITLIIIGLYGLISQGEPQEQYITYTVGTDENLYQIIHDNYDTSGIDYREIEYKIGKVNGLKWTGIIQAGQELKIPAEHFKGDK